MYILLPVSDNITHRLWDHDEMDKEFFNPMSMEPLYCLRPWEPFAKTSQEDSGCHISYDENKYQLKVDVQQYKPEEITVKTVGNSIVVEGKHEEKQDNHGFVSRHFIRKYVLPDDYRVEDVSSTISSDGVLSVLAPKVVPAITSAEKIIPIMKT